MILCCTHVVFIDHYLTCNDMIFAACGLTHLVYYSSGGNLIKNQHESTRLLLVVFAASKVKM